MDKIPMEGLDASRGEGMRGYSGGDIFGEAIHKAANRDAQSVDFMTNMLTNMHSYFANRNGGMPVANPAQLKGYNL